MGPDHFIGLALGQPSQFSALAVLERPAVNPNEHPPSASTYALRHLQRWAVGTPYKVMAQDVTDLATMPPLDGNAALVIDQSAVGRPLVEMLLRAPVQARIVPVTLSGGQAVTVGDHGLNAVPKKELVSCLQLLLQGRRLRVARTLPHVDILMSELLAFRMKTTTAGDDSFELLRERRNDDLVLAVALACWLGEREPQWGEITGSDESDSLMAKLPLGVFASDFQ